MIDLGDHQLDEPTEHGRPCVLCGVGCAWDICDECADLQRELAEAADSEMVGTYWGSEASRAAKGRQR
jgi:hypothetical protein